MTISRSMRRAPSSTYIDETFEKPALQPKNARDRARMHQWISSVNSYYYTYMIYHVTHERLVFPELGIASDEKVVAHALPKVEVGLQVLERQLAHGKNYLSGRRSHACGFLSACRARFPSASRRKARPCIPSIRPSAGGGRRWRRCRPSRSFRASLPPRGPIEHAREWAVSHRPKY